MRILFEGTESQVKNLLLVMESTKIDMPKRLENYALDCLWHASDVRTFYDCSEEEAIDIIHDALNRDSVTDEVYKAIEDMADEKGLVRIGDAYGRNEAILKVNEWYVTPRNVSLGYPQLSLNAKDAKVFDTFDDAVRYSRQFYIQCAVHKKQ